MAPTLKGSRLITVDGAVYRWLVRSRPAYGQNCHAGPLTFAVELASAGGSVLAVTVFDAVRPDSVVTDGRLSLIVRPALVAAVIRAALGRGWQPAVPGAQFWLRLASCDLPAEVRTEIHPALHG